MTEAKRRTLGPHGTIYLCQQVDSILSA